MKFAVPADEKAAYYENARLRASHVIDATRDLINVALEQGCTLLPVTPQQRRDYGALARNAKWCMTFTDGTTYFGETVFAVGRFLNEHLKPEGAVQQ